MGAYGFGVFCFNLKILVGVFFILGVRMEDQTNPDDVAAITSLYAALSSPPLPGWNLTSSSPCSGSWQGVACDGPNIVSIIVIGANLGGELGDDLGRFSSIKIIDLSNNHIAGSIPSNLPLTLERLFLSDNNFSGSIPDSLSSLKNLSAMSLNNNHLSGEIPDSFDGLVHLFNLDLYSNNLSGRLPPSLGNLSLTSLHLQNNQLSGRLDVLQDLPLTDLNIENNLFSGPIPQKLLAIPNFRKDGNPLNGTDAPSPPPTPSQGNPPNGTDAPSPPPTPSKAPLASPPPFVAPTSAPTLPTPASGPAEWADGPSRTGGRMSKKHKSSATFKRIVWISILSIISFVVLVLAVLLCFSKRLSERQDTPKLSMRPKVKKALEKVEHKLSTLDSPTKPLPMLDAHAERFAVMPKGDLEINKYDNDVIPPPPPLPPFLQKRAIVGPQQSTDKHSMRQPPPSSVKSYTIADLQQYTNSFSQDNLIGEGTLGKVFKAKLPNGKLLAVKKLHKIVCNEQTDEEFLEMVSCIGRLQHPNIVELEGYCAEHGERLLVYEYCAMGTLHDALHTLKQNLSWNMRISMALEAAKALEYLHETCEPPVVHGNFKSANVLLDDDGLGVQISDCGLDPLISSEVLGSQLSEQLLTKYGAREFELGIYTSTSDVFIFGVVMLELLTGCEPYDSTRAHGEQLLVRWAGPLLHDINALTNMVDPSLRGSYTPKSLSRFADIIFRCIQEAPEFRPTMSEVVQDIVKMMEEMIGSNDGNIDDSASELRSENIQGH
ncbi:hypothetical protein DM860_009416 [Cuscuta australis]|uniref:Protein kinase domain-containing protein n=1 Tax=Cuscuta australis TaxID=267555 RepID=A0A328DFD4_9ASTE|nr:hypothetical protein DM860_009416 [Cuscuta australis]